MAQQGPGRRRRRRRPRTHTAESGGTPREGWRATVDSFGGFLTIGALAGALIVVVALVVVSQRGAGPGGGSDETYEPIARGAVTGRVEGDPGARVRIFEFSDFQCPFCRDFHEEVAPLLRAEFVETGEASFEYWPVDVLGPDSRRANEAALCAADQNLFWEMHDILFLRQTRSQNDGAFSRDRLKEYAREIEDAVGGFDLARFDACLDSGQKGAEVEALTRQAQAAGITSTPSVIIGSELIRGLNPIDRYREAIRRAAGP